MADYRFLTIWHLDAPIEKVWDAIIHSERWPDYWKAVESVVELQVGEPSGVGNIRRFTWKTPLSYKLAFDTCIQRIDAPVLMEAVAHGEVEGMGLWELEAVENGTIVRYTWTVKTTKVWMNLLAIFIRPLMEWNHNVIMQQGGKAMAQLLNAHLLKNESY
ncbi:polyketide cyclase [Tolypothrix sp. FACHB-123]|uniref:SRPBCC family protein n=1 Tax=Tolypothrix sp. FACHB-123 TaxID=2692868 RepID=UPI00168639FB|nr:SRPBCC family protein [Tolypothrix sp. FACHB-123]MBD2357624.1 polyketide cyclase [Tolypothrix sp. FACHB-123]